MNREQYLQWRNERSIKPVYEYYKEHHKGGIVLEEQDFVNTFRWWEHWQEAASKALQAYDLKFEVTCVSDLKTGQLIRCI